MADKEKQSVDKDMVEAVAEAILRDEEFVRRVVRELNRRDAIPKIPLWPVPTMAPEKVPERTWDAPWGIEFDMSKERAFETLKILSANPRRTARRVGGSAAHWLLRRSDRQDA